MVCTLKTNRVHVFNKSFRSLIVLQSAVLPIRERDYTKSEEIRHKPHRLTPDGAYINLHSEKHHKRWRRQLSLPAQTVLRSDCIRKSKTEKEETQYELTIAEFLTAFGKYKRTICQAFPNWPKDLNEYKTNIIGIYITYEDIRVPQTFFFTKRKCIGCAQN